MGVTVLVFAVELQKVRTKSTSSPGRFSLAFGGANAFSPIIERGL